MSLYKVNLENCGQDFNVILDKNFISKINICFLLGLCEGFLEKRPDLPTDKTSRAWIYILFFPYIALEKPYEIYKDFILETKLEIEENTYPVFQLVIETGKSMWETHEDLESSKIGLSLSYFLVESALPEQS